MFNIEGLLGRFKHITPPDHEVRKEVVLAIAKILHVDIDIAVVSVQNNVVHIKEMGVVKTEIILHQEDILEEIKKTLKEKTPTKIW